MEVLIEKALHEASKAKQRSPSQQTARAQKPAGRPSRFQNDEGENAAALERVAQLRAERRAEEAARARGEVYVSPEQQQQHLAAKKAAAETAERNTALCNRRQARKAAKVAEKGRVAAEKAGAKIHTADQLAGVKPATLESSGTSRKGKKSEAAVSNDQAAASAPAKQSVAVQPEASLAPTALADSKSSELSEAAERKAAEQAAVEQAAAASAAVKTAAAKQVAAVQTAAEKVAVQAAAEKAAVHKAAAAESAADEAAADKAGGSLAAADKRLDQQLMEPQIASSEISKTSKKAGDGKAASGEASETKAIPRAPGDRALAAEQTAYKEAGHTAASTPVEESVAAAKPTASLAPTAAADSGTAGLSASGVTMKIAPAVADELVGAAAASSLADKKANADVLADSAAAASKPMLEQVETGKNAAGAPAFTTEVHHKADSGQTAANKAASTPTTTHQPEKNLAFTAADGMLGISHDPSDLEAQPAPSGLPPRCVACLPVCL